MINPTRILQAPSIEASGLTISEKSDTELRLSWTAGNGVQTIVIVRENTSQYTAPSYNVTYSADSVFGSGDEIGTGNFVVYKNNGNTVLITGLTASTDYTFYVIGINFKGSGTEKYSTGASTTTQTLAPQVAPTIQATNVTFTGDRLVSWTAGNGSKKLVVMREGGAVDSDPVDNSTYTAGNFGEGSEIGTGNFVLYNGTENSFELDPTYLQFNTLYGVRVYEFNVGSGNPKYNTDTATGNPLSHTTILENIYYSYKDTPFLTRRDPYNLSTVSREFSQLYPTADWIGSTHHHVWFVSEGDGSRLTGIDRTIRYRRAIGDDPTVKTNWVKDSPVDSYGDTPSFLDSACLQYNAWVAGSYNIGDRVRTGTTNMQVWESTANGNTSNPTPGAGGSNWTEIPLWDGNQCWMMSVVEHGGYQYGIYVANRFIANRYSVGMIVSNDEFETYSRSETAIISEGATLAAYYCHVHPTKVGSFWYMFIQNYVPSYLVEGHLYSLEIWRTSSDPNPAGTWSGWAKISGTTDQLSGRNYGGAVDISTSWDDGVGGFRAYISPNDFGVDGGYNTGVEGGSVIKSTHPIGNKILEISWTDWEDFKDGHVVEREIYRSEQQSEIDVRTWCPKRTFAGDDFFIGMAFLWKYQTTLGGISQNEPMNEGLIISRNLNTTNAVQVRTEIYPDNVKFVKPNQQHLNDVLGDTTPLPKNVILDTNGTVVGSPKVARANSIQAVDNGFVTFPNADFIYDANYLAVKVTIGQNNLTDVYGICGMDTDVGGGQHGWHIRKSGQNNIEVWVYGSDNTSYKRYRATLSTNKANNDSALMYMVGFEFKNGTLKVRIDYNLNCSVTKLQDDTFTALNVSDEPLRIGAIYPTTNDEMFSKDIVGSLLMWTGVSNVTDDNYLNTNLIGY